MQTAADEARNLLFQNENDRRSALANLEYRAWEIARQLNAQCSWRDIWFHCESQLGDLPNNRQAQRRLQAFASRHNLLVFFRPMTKSWVVERAISAGAN